jgi:DNA-binding NtrC family response regulator
MTTVLIADDEPTARSFLREILAEHGYEATEAESLAEARQKIDQGETDIVLLDLQFPEGNGLDLLDHASRLAPGMPVIVITGYGDVETVVEAWQMGALDFVEKPVNVPRLLRGLSRAADSVRMHRELDLLRRSQRDHQEWIVGETPAMKEASAIVSRVSGSNASVLITGESGVGKEVVAQVLHERSPRCGRPFVAINCAALPDDLIESDLFGHEQGAFTSAQKRKEGMMQVADGGTLFLDEISAMKPEMQAKLLRALEDRKIRRVGGTTDIKVDVRILAASNRNLPKMIEEGTFREDLYYRLNVVPICLPPLRKRRDDIPAFVGAFIRKYNQEQGRSVQGCSPRALEALKAYDWPGNTRQLRNVIERAMLFCDGDQIDIGHLPAEFRK